MRPGRRIASSPTTGRSSKRRRRAPRSSRLPTGLQARARGDDSSRRAYEPRPRRGPRSPVAGRPYAGSNDHRIVTIGTYPSKGGMRMAVPADERTMISERVAPGMLPRVLNSFDMTIIFVAIVLFIVNASAIQQAHQAAFTYWILGFLLFLIPGALVTAHLGQMFPQEGSLYVWTQKALGPFWGFFAGFCAWWPGILVMVATG